jgi:tetratricopeptide (TPR) repeat protein
MIMKIKIICTSILICCILTSCEKYLDIKTESSQVFIKSSQDCQRLLDNYSVLNVGYPSDGEASAGDFFLTDASYLSPARSEEDRGIYTWQSSALRRLAAPQWTNTYFKIYTTNLVLEALDDLSDKPNQNVLNNLKGAALFYRAFGFWQIAQLYAPPFTSVSANSDLGIPLRLSSDINTVSIRNSVLENYNRIISDLEEASNLLPNLPVVSSRPSRAAALAMLARVYLSMENYDKALENSTAALTIKNELLDYNTISTTSLTPFARFNKEVLFHAVMVQSALLTGGTTGSNAAKIDKALYDSYADNDIRKTVFFKPVSGVVNAYAFTGNYEPSTNGTNFIGIAIDEVFLIRAECFARAGKISEALSDINLLLKSRYKSSFVSINLNDPTETLRFILNERRKELLMRNLRWSDLRRLNKDNRFATTLRRIVQGVEYQLGPNDLRYTLLIPNEVIVNAGISQNKR